MVNIRRDSCFYLCIFAVFLSVSNANAEPICSAYQPYTDGCSDYGVDDVNFATDFEGACNTHDICYQIIGRSQSGCDADFRNNMISSCEDKYLRFEAWKKIGTEEIIEWVTCWAIFGPYPCQITKYKDIYDWVEVARELAERTIELPNYPVCLGAVPVYEGAVRIFGDTYYERNQRHAIYHAEQLAANQLNGACSIYTSADMSNLFANSNESVTRSLYKNILGREPSQEEYAEAVNLENTYIDWEYHVVKNNSDDRMIASLVPVIALILN